MTVEQRRDDSGDQFPLGMRVLAVDDDPICLKLLETLLRKCQYHVTTTSQAIVALKMLRENKNMFDLVISDVHMPDMDGFKLLELVGLEMDLPVIMLSANGDTKLVMKGITHGACDYLVKPVRMEELKNIWQHVLRKKKPESKDRNSSSTHDKNSAQENGFGNGNFDNDSKLGKKRKDQYSDDDDEQDENEHDEDPSAQKKSRVVWSMELHSKFVGAVNQLGLDKAVPKKILELMNVEKLTRENVASHLQKYRLYLKRISSMNNQQANMVAALGGPDSPYLRMNSVNFHNFNNSTQFQNNGLRPLPPAGVYGRLNTPVGMGLNGLSSSGIGPLGPRNSLQKFQPGDQTGTVLQGMPTSLEFDQLQPKIDNTRIFSASVSNNSLLSLPNSSMTMQGNHLDRKNHEVYGINSDRCNGNWPSAIQSNSAPPSISPMETLANEISPRLDTQFQAGTNMVQVWDDSKLDILNPTGLLDSSMGSYPIGDPRSRSVALNRNVGFSSLSEPRYDLLATQHNQEPGTYVGDAGSLEDVVTARFRRV